MDDRGAYIAGLRQLADLLEQHDELPLPYQGRGMPMTFHYLAGRDAREEIAAFARAFPGKLDKQISGAGDYFDLSGKLAGLSIQATAYREQVCVKRVVGTETVEVEERDGEDTRPVVTKTVKREIVEWDCPPLLAESAVS